MCRQLLYLATVVIQIPVCVIAVIAALTTAQAGFAQEAAVPRLIITARSDGFEGTFRSGETTYRLENYVKEKSYKVRVYRPNGDVLIEARREGELTFVSLPTGELKINASNPVPFSPEESKAIQAFIKSEDALVVRRIVYEVIAKRKSETRPLVAGFNVIAMLLGEA